jgi:hypothetical protein
MTSVQSRAVAGAAWCLVLGWLAFVRGRAIPVLALVDLGFHELGHLLTYPLPWDVVTAAMGSVFQVAVPLGLACYFVVVRRDVIAGGVCLAWSGTAAQNASLYIADAPYEELPLIGGTHDWAFILGEHYDALDKAAGLGHAVWLVGLVTLLLGLAACAASPFLLRWEARRAGERLASDARIQAAAGRITIIS